MLVAASQWTQKDVMKAMRYGVDDIVMLPVDSEELLQKIRGLEPLSV
jgi:PleD family two-component response regulator